MLFLMRKQLLFFLLVLSSGIWAQNEMLLKGKIMGNIRDLEGIMVINVTAAKYVATTNDGHFAIAAKVGDTLRFSAVQVDEKTLVLKQEDFCENLLLVRLEPQVHQLSELIIKDYSHINAESLGLVKKGQMKFTPAERKLNTASNSYAAIGLNGSAGLDPLLNWISGRTAMLKKEVEVEKKERMQNHLKNLFEEDYYISHFKIPDQYVGGFLVYASENSRLMAAITSKNKILTLFLLGELAVEYLKILADEE
ncbi:hypothetical protein IP98_00691 [Flavobacterium cauense R2A-7]|uniref:Carboxypeptidase-like protein n=2 Tax=Flavobacterium TaxID=237 RepID=A0A562M4C4_9FLAO|nr:hypothetical protein IP98_00691 [Flavobacterium cauense R2A-7]